MLVFLQQKDLAELPALQPSGWTDIVPYFEFYLSSPFCKPVKIVQNNVIVGLGNAILLGETGWLSHILVHPEKRNLGIGGEITRALVDILKGEKCSTLLLLATELGEPVYRKTGFQPELRYLFFRNGKAINDAPVLSAFSSGFESVICDMDRRISGENRQQLLIPHLNKAKLVIENNVVTGCYLPSLGEGLIIADTEHAGITLLNERHKTLQKTAVPETNLAAIAFLQKQSFEQFSQGTRMYLGKKIVWQPERLYSRVGGNLG
ncbi:MAG: GNAT family N-acetyltransferase [Flavobacterium sp.]